MKRSLFQISPSFYLVMALLLLLLPIKWVLCWFVTTTVHEFSHFITLHILGAKVLRVRIGLRGAVMETEPISNHTEIISAAAGPLGGGLLLFLYPISREIFVCALFQTVYNLLPIYPQDGGRILFIILTNCVGERRAHRIMRGVRLTVFSCIGVIIIYLLVVRKDILLATLLISLFAAMGIGKITCKDSEQIVQ